MKLTIRPDPISSYSYFECVLGEWEDRATPVYRLHISSDLDDLISEALSRDGMVEIDLDAFLIAALNERENERENERKSERVSPEKVSETVITVDLETTGQYNTEALKSGDIDWLKTLFGDAPFSPMNWVHWGDTLRQVTDYAALAADPKEWLEMPPKDKNFRWRLRKGRVVG